jgi:hypothetical protein
MGITIKRPMVAMEDPLIYMVEQPVCSDSQCPCHQDAQEPWQEAQAIPASVEQHAPACASEIGESTP